MGADIRGILLGRLNDVDDTESPLSPICWGSSPLGSSLLGRLKLLVPVVKTDKKLTESRKNIIFSPPHSALKVKDKCDI